MLRSSCLRATVPSADVETPPAAPSPRRCARSPATGRPRAPKAPNPRRVVRERAVDWVLDGRTVGESADALGLPVSVGFHFSPAGFAGLQNAVTCRGLLTRFRRAGLAGWQVYLRLPVSIWSSQLNISTRILLNLLFRYLTPLFFNSR